MMAAGQACCIAFLESQLLWSLARLRWAARLPHPLCGQARMVVGRPHLQHVLRGRDVSRARTCVELGVLLVNLYALCSANARQRHLQAGPSRQGGHGASAKHDAEGPGTAWPMIRIFLKAADSRAEVKELMKSIGFGYPGGPDRAANLELCRGQQLWDSPRGSRP